MVKFNVSDMEVNEFVDIMVKYNSPKGNISVERVGEIVFVNIE